MVNPIDQILIRNETHHSLPLQVTQHLVDFAYIIFYSQKLCIRNHLKILREKSFKEGKSWLYQWLIDLYFLNLYHKTSVCRANSEKKTSSPSLQMNVRCQSQAQIRRYYWEYQRYTESNRQNSSEDINVWWKLYKSIFGEYRYTSLELAVRLGTLVADPIAKFRLPILSG
jgi:hypothetical protein